MSSVTVGSAPVNGPTFATRPVALAMSPGLFWMVGMVIVGMAIYYFVGIDEGAWSVFGKSMYVHEFVHDSRHFLGFPCH